MRKRANDMPIIVVLLVLALFGCNKKEQPPPAKAPAPAKPAAQVPKPVQTPVSSAKTADTQAIGIDFTKMKDPFKPYISELPKVSEKTGLPQISPNALPIERYEVSSFKVAGIIVGLNQNTALVVDPAGKAYVVKPGMTIGTNNGRITKITHNTIEIDEKSKEAGSRGKRRLVKLSLPQKK